MTNPTSNFGWQMPTSTDLVTDLPADFEVFGQAVDTSLADLKGGTTGQVLSKASNTDMDFTWVAQDDSNAIQNAIVDAKGDLIAATAADTPARIGVGTNGQVLSANSSAATGLEWITLAAGGGDLYSQDFTSSGTFSVPSGVDKVLVLAVGGGGAGGGCLSGGGTYQVGGGGGGGQIKFEPVAVTAGGSVTVTIGAGGTGGTGRGASGGSTTFGALLTALGGDGGGDTGIYAPATNGQNQGGAGLRNGTYYIAGGGGGGATSNGGSPLTGEATSGETNFTASGIGNTNSLGSSGGRAVYGNKWYYGGIGGAGWLNMGGGGGAYGPMGGGYGTDGGGYNTTSSNAGQANTGGGGRGSSTTSDSSVNGYNGGSGFLRVIWVAS